MHKTIRLNVAHYFIMKIPKKRKLEQKASNHLPGTEFEDFMKLCEDYTIEKISFLVNNTLYCQIILYDSGRTYYKVTVSEKVKIVDNKIEQNKAQ